MKTDDKKTTGKNKRTLTKQDAVSKKPAYKGTKEKAQEPSESEEIKETPDTKATELDKDIRNDIQKTEINPHVKKRQPLNNENHAIDPEEVNEDRRIVNDREDDQVTNKYNSL